MKPELMSHKDLLARVRTLEDQNAAMLYILSEVQKVFDENMPLVAEQTDQAIREFKKKAVA